MLPPSPLRDPLPPRDPRGEQKLFVYALAVLTALLLCAWTPKPAHLDIKSIGIIAAVGDTSLFEYESDGVLEWIGPPEARFLEISDWDIDNEVTKFITATLDSEIRTQPIAIEHQDFDTWTYDSLARRIRELPMPETPVDAYLLVLRDWRSAGIGGTSHQLGGLGLYRRDLPGHAERYGVFAAYRLILMEPERGGIIATRPAVLPNGHLPWLPVSATLWPPAPINLSDVQRTTLHADFMKLIKASLPGTLRRLGLATR